MKKGSGETGSACVYAYMHVCIYAYIHQEGAVRQGELPERGSCLSPPNVLATRPGGDTNGQDIWGSPKTEFQDWLQASLLFFSFFVVDCCCVFAGTLFWGISVVLVAAIEFGFKFSFFRYPILGHFSHLGGCHRVRLPQILGFPETLFWGNSVFLVVAIEFQFFKLEGKLRT